MDLTYARKIIRSLAEGIDPSTGELLPQESVYNRPDVIRALYTILEATAPKPLAPAPAQQPFRNAGKPWTDIEEEKLTDEYTSGMKISDIALEHGRSYGAIESRLEQLGLHQIRLFQYYRYHQ